MTRWKIYILPTAYTIFISYYFQFSLSYLPVNPAYPQSLLISTKFVIDNQVTTLKNLEYNSNC